MVRGPKPRRQALSSVLELASMLSPREMQIFLEACKTMNPAALSSTNLAEKYNIGEGAARVVKTRLRAKLRGHERRDELVRLGVTQAREQGVRRYARCKRCNFRAFLEVPFRIKHGEARKQGIPMSIPCPVCASAKTDPIPDCDFDDRIEIVMAFVDNRDDIDAFYRDVLPLPD